jgi:hypothetical protein
MTRTLEDRLEEPRDAFAKVHFLQTYALPRRFPGSETETDLAEKIGIKRETLRDQRHKSRLSTNVQSALAKAFEFSIEWPEWQTGTAQEFEQKYKSIHPDRRPSAPERRTDIRLVRGPRRPPAPSRIEGFVAVEIDGSQFGPGTAAIDVMVSCGTPIIEGAHTTIRSGRIVLRCSPAVLTRNARDGWLTGQRTIAGSRGPVHISFEAGTSGAPGWRITADGVSIGSIALDPDFAALEELAPGDEIPLEFGTWLPEIQEVSGLTDDPQPTADALAIVQGDGVELNVPAPKLSKMKQRIIACIRKTAVLAPHDNGYVVLASHVLKVVEAKS